ncbi:2-hydroxychromene-2-carboxylate isomerase [Altererythrobacter sp. ZODW24]|uniref:2-hydroxychromene-2-carboxylate isomerase n=1 Tax=Altererythrobacter sp. ZODW24 TaxID=2185142 RepID=UPI000DF7FBBF|nr:2-hydroxychromene-2-carboxylate isomerase [Altererythrobacter sp. ZODW24]
MSKTVELLFDFVSPNAYLVWQPLKDIAARTGAKIKVTPVFLGGMHKLTGNAPPFIRDGEVKGKNAYAMLEMNRFIKVHGMDRFTMNPNFPFNSILLQRLLVAATDDGREMELIDFFLPHIWENGTNVADAEIVTELLANSEFDAAALLAKTQDAAIKQRLVDNTSGGVERGAFGIPTFYIGDEMFFGKERLGQIETELQG